MYVRVCPLYEEALGWGTTINHFLPCGFCHCLFFFSPNCKENKQEDALLQDQAQQVQRIRPVERLLPPVLRVGHQHSALSTPPLPRPHTALCSVPVVFSIWSTILSLFSVRLFQENLLSNPVGLWEGYPHTLMP